MNPIAVFTGGITIYWSSLIIALGILACFALTYSLFTAHGGKSVTMWALLLLGTVFSIVLSRALHWYCHFEQYTSLWQSLTDYTVGSYCLPGAFFGVLLAIILIRVLGLTSKPGRLLDCLAPGAVLAIAFIRLSALFNYSCRGKIVVNTAALQHLPLASRIGTGDEYRFATFFIEFLVLLVLFIWLIRFFFKRRRTAMKADMPREGNVALMFLLWYSAIEFVCDSTRYDSSFLRSNGFVSIVQIICAVSILIVLIIYSVRSVKANGLGALHFVIWVGWLASLACVGVSEYLVQRHGNWYLGCYSVMSAACFALGFFVYKMYTSVCRRRKETDDL